MPKHPIDEPIVFQAVEWGDNVPGESRPRYVTLQAVGKVDREPWRCVVASEYICARMAMLLGLPTPPPGITRSDKAALAFFSLRFGSLRHEPARIRPSDLVHEFARIAAGIVIFDAWILNDDRHEKNLAVDRSGPIIFDHGSAFGAGGHRNSLSNDNNDLPIEQHCLAPLIEHESHLVDWSLQLRNLNEQMFAPAIDQMVTVGALSKEEGSIVRRMLVHRRDRAQSYVEDLLDTSTPTIHEGSD